MRTFMVAVCFLVFALQADAQAVRTFVATYGLDTNPCSRTQPCRNFATAVGATAAGGEVVVLDSGGYGAVTIDKSITILAPAAVHAAIAPTTGAAITLNAGAADKVVIRNLYLNAQGAWFGIEVASVRSVHVEGLVINGFANSGINVSPSETSDFFMADTVIRNGNVSGMNVIGPDLGVQVFMTRSRIENNVSNGVQVWTNGSVLAVDSSVSGSQVGFRARAVSAKVVLERCVLAGNQWGVFSDMEQPVGSAASNFDVSNSTIAFNDSGIGGLGRSRSRGNNTMSNNTMDGSFTSVFAPQ